MKKIFALLLITSSLQAQTPRINFTAPALYPEGTAYDSSHQRFFVTSVKTGTIGSVDANGKYSVFYEDMGLKSTFGMKVDSKNNCVWVCAGDPNYSIYSDPSTFKKMARLVAIDLSTGQKKKDIDLSMLYDGKHFANDLTLDDAGNIYITDSYSPVIYRVDANGQASIFAQSDYFKSLDIGLNGIVWHPSGFLLVVNNGSGAIYKVDIKTPSSITRVKTNTFFLGGDGLLLDDQNNLLVVQNKGIDKVSKLNSRDNWASAGVIASTGGTDRFQNPSTITLRGNKLYVLNAKLNEIQDPSIKPSTKFSLQLAEFKPAK